ncbi:uncharacterized protein LOC135834325 [Planococcus citri]|uniref:uncharacterized protein LOC135834325 n=1 Tax=Planococcus citri TaxID=170843 RepID=UPI0031F9E421
MSKPRKQTPAAAQPEKDTLHDEMNDNEEVLIELEECLKSKSETIDNLKQNITNLENDIKRYTSPYNSEKSTLEEDISIFRNIASKYVKNDLVDFYVDRMKKCAANKVESDSSTISALCEVISKDGS